MRLVMMVLAGALVTTAATDPATAGGRGDYPWCAQGQGYGYPGECSYETYAQCQASVSGRMLGCGENPSYLFSAADDPRPMRRPHRHHRRHHHD
ncbi:MAG: DUF3551 domain-containing protein [Alphaproteobacteria bacterium]|nr:DUF3551 domain-containing protein [Alphaproteobacteria bacterium]